MPPLDLRFLDDYAALVTEKLKALRGDDDDGPGFDPDDLEDF